MDEHLAVVMCGRGDRDGARARRGGLPHAALPDPGRDLARPVDARDLDVRALGKALMRLEEGTKLGNPIRVADNDRVRVPDRDRSQLHTGNDLRR